MPAAIPIETTYGPRLPWTVETVLEAMRAGVLRGDDRRELLEGELIEMPPIGPEHASRTNLIGYRLQRAYGLDAFVAYANPIALGRSSRPQPDLAVYRGEPGDYLGRDPEGPEALLVVEVADSTQRRDQAKAALYAAGGVPVYWIVDLPARAIRVYTDPGPEGYGAFTTRRVGDEVEVPGTDVRLAVAELV